MALAAAIITLGVWYVAKDRQSIRVALRYLANTLYGRVRSWERTGVNLLVGFCIGLLLVALGVSVYRGASPFQQGGWSDRHEAIRIGLQAFTGRPILGYGPENFVVGFSKHADPERFTRPELQFDSSHNHFVDALVETGILGLPS